MPGDGIEAIHLVPVSLEDDEVQTADGGTDVLFRLIHQMHRHAVVSLRWDVRVDEPGQLNELRVVRVPKTIHLQRVHIKSRMEVLVIQNNAVQINVQRCENLS